MRRMFLIGSVALLVMFFQFHLFYGQSAKDLPDRMRWTLLQYVDALSSRLIPRKLTTGEEKSQLIIEATFFCGIVLYRVNAANERGAVMYCSIDYLRG